MIIPQHWPPPPPKLTLADHEAHVWLTSLALSPDALGRMAALLSADEREKAARFRFEKDRQHYMAAHGVLRSILGKYLETAPAQLQFFCNAFGKPSLARNSVPLLHFNLSHSHGLALCAITRDREVGIDLEFIRPEVATDPLAEKFFAPREVATLRALAPGLQPRAFFDCWTRKEAYVKARGDGLSRRLNSFAVALAPGEAPAILWAEDDPQASSRWSVHELNGPDGYAATLVVEGRGAQIQCWQWPG